MRSGADELPPGWVECTFSDLGKWGSGGTPSRKDREAFGGSIPWLKIGDLPNGPVTSTEEFITAHGLRSSSAKLLPSNTLLIAMYGASIGKLGVTTVPCTTNQAIASCEPHQGIDLRFLFYYSLSQRQKLIALGQGGAQPNISQSILKEQPVRLAPHLEQVRVVSKIDELFSSIDEGERALERVRKLVDRYRQSVLKAAVTGELTREWREQHAGKLESGEALLIRILEARRQAWEQCELAKMKAKGVRPLNEHWRRKYIEPTLASFGLSDALPIGWADTSVESVTQAERPIAYGVLQPGSELEVGVPLVRVCDVNDQQIAEDQLKHIDPKIANAYPRTRLSGGEVLLTIVGTIGRTAVASKRLKGANVARAVSVLVSGELMTAEWLEVFLRHSRTRQLLTENSREVARKTLNLEQLRELAIQVPPLIEQREAVSLLNDLWSKASAVTDYISDELKRSEGLRQSILKSAFAGQLVPQDPTDEPASVLLERIAAERAAAPKRVAAKKQKSKRRFPSGMTTKEKKAKA